MVICSPLTSGDLGHTHPSPAERTENTFLDFGKILCSIAAEPFLYFIQLLFTFPFCVENFLSSLVS